MGKYVCARPVHPGEILKEEVEYRGLSQGKLAAQMGIPYKTLNQILNERRPLTAQTAMLFEATLGISANLLMNMQTDYNMQVVNRDKSFLDSLAEIRKKVAVFTLSCHPV
jgi:addiction module HigA family antidote